MRAVNKKTPAPRQEEIKSNGRLRGVFYMLSILGLGYSLFSGGEFWLDGPVQKVSISGDLQFVREDEVKTSLNSAINTSFLQLDLKKVKAVLEQHPWINDADVQRQWPYKLHVVIKEEMPIARWKSNGFVNQNGEVITVGQDEKIDGLTKLSGSTEQSAELLQTYKQLADQAVARQLHIESLEKDRVGGVSIKFTDGSLLLLGREQLQERMQRFLKVYQTTKTARLIFDARYSRGIAVAQAVDSQQLAMH